MKNWTLTLPNGASLKGSSYGYAYMNVSVGSSLSYNGTELSKAALYNFFVIYYDASTKMARATEILLHWCVKTYKTTVDDNIPSTLETASYVNTHYGETTVQTYNNMTANVTYLTTPDDPNATYVADGLGIREIRKILTGDLPGSYLDLGQFSFGNGTELLGLAISRSHSVHWDQGHGTQDYVNAEWVAMRNFSQNIATGLTNALV